MPDGRLAVIASRLAAGDAAAARQAADAMLADGGVDTADRVAALVLRARAHEDLRELRKAIVDLDGALALDAKQARVWNELGLLCADSGLSDRAIAAFEMATRNDPNYARAWNNLGNALRTAGRIANAVRAGERAVQADPSYTLAWANLGALKRDVGDDDGAELALRRALALDSAQRGALLTLGGLLRERSDLANAADLFTRLVTADPRDANAALQLAGTLAERGEPAAARQAYAQALARDPGLLRAAFGRDLTLPIVPASAAAVAAAREDYAAGLSRLEAELPSRAAALAPDRLLDELRWSNFLLAYQGEDDRALQLRYGTLAERLLTAGAPEWMRPLTSRVRTGSRVRVGFVATFFRDGTISRYFEHWVRGLPREDFEVFVYHLLPGVDTVAQRLAQGVEHFRHLPWWRPSQLAPRIRADALDVLVYPELGMGTVPFALASLRLAPLQCAGWGHPVTTGLPNVDVFLSSAAMEPPDAAGHYSERLVTLPGIGTRYVAPAVPPDASRASLGLPEGEPLLLCPQSLFKIHPDNDPLFAAVLRALPEARLLFFEGRDPALTDAFRRRLEQAGIPPDRVRLVPQCRHDDYLRINTVCDVMLDTLRWSGGNTSLDALACALPLVTLPGRFMRGRQSAGMLKLMGIEELIAKDADDYVQIVTRLVRDAEWRKDVAARIRAAQSRLFDDPAPIAALAAFLRG
jgi:predicted O-linked N-acetylglucosamine transferase (SPINDLY family)